MGKVRGEEAVLNHFEELQMQHYITRGPHGDL